MKVSVVMPCRDAAPYLPEAVASVRRQAGVEWELLVVDDGSTDASLSLAREQAEADPRIRVLATGADRRGAAAARNVGLAAADGDLMAFLDADDVLLPGTLHHRAEALRAQPAAVATYGPSRWRHPGHPHLDRDERMRGVAGRVHPPPALLNKVVLLNRSDVPCTCGVVVRAGAVREVGGFDEGFYLFEDQTLWVKLFLRHPVHVDAFVGAEYRRHPGSLTARVDGPGAFGTPRHASARQNFLDWVESYARHEGRLDASVERSLRIARHRAEGPAPADGSHRAAVTRSDRLAASWLEVESTFTRQAARARRWRRRAGLAVRDKRARA